jgi:hypothetical protein
LEELAKKIHHVLKNFNSCHEENVSTRRIFHHIDRIKKNISTFESAKILNSSTSLLVNNSLC